MFGVEILGWSMAVLLVAARLAMLFIATPVFASVPVPATARVILLLALASGLATGVQVVPGSFDPGWLASAVLQEVVVGGALASGLFAGFGAFHFAGRLLDMQIGYGMSNLVDIATRANAPLLGSLLMMLGVLVFFSVEGHLTLLRLVKLSLERIPPGGGLGSLDFAAVVAQFASCFVFGLALVAPVVLGLLLVDFGVAFMSRTMPQMNVFLIALALKAAVGLALLALMLPMSGGLMRRVFESIHQGQLRVLG